MALWTQRCAGAQHTCMIRTFSVRCCSESRCSLCFRLSTVFSRYWRCLQGKKTCELVTYTCKPDHLLQVLALPSGGQPGNC